MNTGKGANNIISMLHHFLQTHSLGEATLHLHADNCSGQNKNRFMMQYLAWQVLVGLNKKIALSFLIVGHTKFWCFGLFKQTYRRTKVDCLDDIVQVVESSAVVNHAQLVGTQDGTVLVPTYDWAKFFDKPFRQEWNQRRAPPNIYKGLTGYSSRQGLRYQSGERDRSSAGQDIEVYFSRPSSHHSSTGTFTREAPVHVREDLHVCPSRLSRSSLSKS